jgi:ribosomal protein S18 acetylase RimI-like enzyme
MALIALDANSHEAIGAAWMRIFSRPQKGYGYVADGTPELGIAVLPEHRGRGIGSALLRRLIEIATSSYDAVSLSVSSDNPAQRLYQRAGFERVGSSGDSILSPCGASEARGGGIAVYRALSARSEHHLTLDVRSLSY